MFAVNVRTLSSLFHFSSDEMSDVNAS